MTFLITFSSVLRVDNGRRLFWQRETRLQ